MSIQGGNKLIASLRKAVLHLKDRRKDNSLEDKFCRDIEAIQIQVSLLTTTYDSSEQHCEVIRKFNEQMTDIQRQLRELKQKAEYLKLLENESLDRLIYRATIIATKLYPLNRVNSEDTELPEWECPISWKSSSECEDYIILSTGNIYDRDSLLKYVKKNENYVDPSNMLSLSRFDIEQLVALENGEQPADIFAEESDETPQDESFNISLMPEEKNKALNRAPDTLKDKAAENQPLLAGESSSNDNHSKPAITFKDFVKAYNHDFRHAARKNPFSTMKWALMFGVYKSMEDVEKHVKKKPKSRSARVLLQMRG